MRLSRAVGLPLLALLLLSALIASVVSGEGSPSEALSVLTGGGPDWLGNVVWPIRVPRALLTALVGGSLALSGAVFQALLRNPLAEPYILGVSAGGATGAVIAILLGWSTASSWGLPLAAFVGALGAMALVLVIAQGVRRRLDPGVLLLAGVVVGAFLNAVILLLLTLADIDSFRSAIFWLMGSFEGASWSDVTAVSLYLVPATIVLLSLARAFDLLAMGEETALFLGTRVERVKLAAYLVTSLLVGAAVAVSGIIGFVGLIVPHAIRLVWGSDHRFLLPASLLAGGAFLVLTDTVARTVAAPTQIPTGIVTALIGVPCFVVILVRSRR